MSDRVQAIDVFTATVEHTLLPAEEIEQGSPTTGILDFGALGSTTVGIWEMSEGAARDTEAEEIFVVLSGAGTVHFEDGSTVALRPGVAVRLHAGERTIWNITETLRKIFVAIG